MTKTIFILQRFYGLAYLFCGNCSNNKNLSCLNSPGFFSAVVSQASDNFVPIKTPIESVLKNNIKLIIGHSYYITTKSKSISDWLLLFLSYTERKQKFKYLLKFQPKSCLKNSARIFSTRVIKSATVEQKRQNTQSMSLQVFESTTCRYQNIQLTLN